MYRYFKNYNESPFPYLSSLSEIWKRHSLNNYDATFFDNIIEGCGFEIISLNALKNLIKMEKNIDQNYVHYILEKIKTNLKF